MLRHLRSLKVMAFVLLAGGLVMAAEASQAVAESFLADEEAQMASLVNQHRSSKGLGSLALHEGLRMVARRQAQRMVVAGYIYHNPDLGAEAGAAVPNWLLLGENVGVGPSVALVEEAFLNSPKHRENIETGRFNNIGVGAMAANDGALYFTQNFADLRAKAVAPAAAAARPAASVVRVPKAKPAGRALAATPAPTPVITPAPTPQTTPAVLGAQKDRQRPVGLIGGLTAMLARFLAKLAFWR